AQPRERSPPRRDRAKFSVEVPAPKERDANTHALKAGTRQRAEPVRRERDVLHAFGESHDAVGDQGRLSADEKRRVDMAGAHSLYKSTKPRDYRLVLCLSLVTLTSAA